MDGEEEQVEETCPPVHITGADARRLLGDEFVLDVWYVLAWHAGLRTGPGEAVCPISCLDQGAVRDRLQLACVVHRMLLVPGSLSLCTTAVAGCSM